MRHVNGVYAQYHNFLRRTDGPLSRGRYKAINIEASSYLLEVSRYIHRNLAETKKLLVERSVNYRWSSCPAYLNNAECLDWLYASAVHEELGSGQPVGWAKVRKPNIPALNYYTIIIRLLLNSATIGA